jgi:hypothetical protein
LKLVKFICLLIIFDVTLSCTKKKEDEEEEADDTPLVLENLGVNFAEYDADDGMAGDFDFTSSTNVRGEGGTGTNCAANSQLFFEFGYVGETKLLPTFEYRVVDSAKVVSPVDGIVIAAEEQEVGDYAVVIARGVDASWRLEIDHLNNLQVAEGDVVKAGDYLGTAGEWDLEEDDQGRTEIMLYNYDTGLSYCPFDYFNEETKDDYIAAIETHMDEWESETCKGETIWQRDEMHVIGCKCKSMSGESDVSACED